MWVRNLPLHQSEIAMLVGEYVVVDESPASLRTMSGEQNVIKSPVGATR